MILSPFEKSLYGAPMMQLTNRYRIYSNLALLGAGVAIIFYLMVSPIIKTIEEQAENNLDIVYTANHFNSHFKHYDDQVKLASTMRLARDGTIYGKFVTKDNDDKIYPNTLQEISVALIFAPVVWATDSTDAPYYALALTVAATYVLLFCLSKTWTNNIVMAFFMPFIVILGYTYFSFSADYWEYIVSPLKLWTYVQSNTMRMEGELNSFYRVHTMGGSYWLFLIFFYQFYILIDKQVLSKNGAVGLALTTALMFYTYIFYSIVAGFLLLIAFINFYVGSFFSSADRKDLLVRLFLSGVMALVIAFPSIFETLSLVLNDSNREWYARINGVVSEEGYVFPQTVGLMIFGAALLFLSPNKSFRFTGISLALITLIIENLDFFIGHNLQPGHVYMRVTLPIMLTMAMVLAYQALRLCCSRFIGVSVLAGSVGAMIYGFMFLASGITYSNSVAKNTFAFQGLSRDQSELYSWIGNRDNRHIYATLNPEVGFPLPTHSGGYLYLYFSGYQYASTTNEQIANKLALVFWSLQMDTGAVKDYFDQEQGNPVERRYHYYYWQRYFGYPKYTKDFAELISGIVRKVDQIEKNPKEYLCPRPFDYLIVDRSKPRALSAAGIKGEYFELVRTFGSLEVWALNSRKCGLDKTLTRRSAV